MTTHSDRPSFVADKAKQLGLLFARNDQTLLAGMILLSLTAISVWAWLYTVRVNKLIDIDQRSHRTAQFQIDLNSATWEEITALPGIGENLAKKIVSHREQVGLFRNNHAVQTVSGIGPHLFRKIAPYLTDDSTDDEAGTQITFAASTQ